MTSRRRRAAGWLDHLRQAFHRYIADSSDRLAASITYYGFLSVFPMLLIVAGVVGYVLRGDFDRQQRLLERINAYLPGDLARQVVDVITQNAGTAGLVGIAGLVLAGLGWLDALRESIRSVWHQAPVSGSIVKKKLRDLGILAGLGITVLLSLAITAAGSIATRHGLEWLGVDRTSGAAIVLAVVSVVVALVTDMALFAYLFFGLPRVSRPRRRILEAAAFGAVGLEILKLLGVYYIDLVTTAGAVVYGASLAAGFGVLIWINLVSRFILYAAAWAVTAPYDDDVAPSGTA